MLTEVVILLLFLAIFFTPLFRHCEPFFPGTARHYSPRSEAKWEGRCGEAISSQFGDCFGLGFDVYVSIISPRNDRLIL